MSLTPTFSIEYIVNILEGKSLLKLLSLYGRVERIKQTKHIQEEKKESDTFAQPKFHNAILH